jgi:phosphoribosylaminoimidazolecarboxamide formyltransferase/IMP cyclohydrolase
MIRAAAKNHAYVAVVVDPADYARCWPNSPPDNGGTDPRCAKKLAAKAYARTAAYDAAISNWFAEQLGIAAPVLARLRRQAGRGDALRREPAPAGGFYAPASAPGVATARSCRARSSPTTTSTTPTPPSSWSPSSTRSAPRPSPSSSTPIPAASAEGPLLDAYRKALACDPVSAFGGIVALNRTLDARAADRDRQDLHRSDHRPDATDEAIAIVAAKKNLRLLLTGGLPDPRAPGLTVKIRRRRLPRAVARQRPVDDIDLKVVTKRAPTRPNWPICASPSASPSTSSRTPSSMRRTARPSASAPAR